jgi:hypothetical protein
MRKDAIATERSQTVHHYSLCAPYGCAGKRYKRRDRTTMCPCCTRRYLREVVVEQPDRVVSHDQPRRGPEEQGGLGERPSRRQRGMRIEVFVSLAGALPPITPTDGKSRALLAITDGS